MLRRPRPCLTRRRTRTSSSSTGSTSRPPSAMSTPVRTHAFFFSILSIESRKYCSDVYKLYLMLSAHKFVLPKLSLQYMLVVFCGEYIDSNDSTAALLFAL